ncbi:MAG: hypothetical protein KME45_15430 [Stenomitos rutilans HA7619-LM2]|jgi:hypothetical protein|nr:hypothetical protein [Stenomitos rutilans HA7619-LM2]
MKVSSLVAFSLLAFLSTVHQAAQADESGAIDFSLTANTPSSSVASALIEQSEAAPAPPSTPASSALSFAPPAASPSPPAPKPVALKESPTPDVATEQGSDIFAGGSDSLVARTVGHAEGTRTADGSKTRAYYGHSDPGNGVWNLGSFSYQHGAKSPEEADERQLRRLQQQADVIRQRADSHRLNLSLEEELNAIDLANQAPLAALDTPGYIEWLKKARDRGLTGSDAVLWARTQSYWNPRRNRWEAPGLGNTEDGISHDQNRRLTAISRALGTYQQQALARRKEDEPQDKVADKPPAEKVANSIIFQDLSQPKPGEIAQAN